MSFEDWVRAYAEALGLPAPSPGDVEAVLELASVAAHSSERRAAPVTCWLAARSDLGPGEALALARRLVEPGA